MNENTHSLLIRDYFDIPKKEWGSKECYDAFYTIDAFTLLTDQEVEFEKRNNPSLNFISYNDKIHKFEYKKGDTIFQFIRISDYLDVGLLKKELLSEERYHKCHSMAIKMSNYFYDSKISTGYITVLNGKMLHSVLEFNLFGETVMLDWVLNIIMPKDQYIKLTAYKEINVVHSKMIQDDEELIYNADITNKVYLLFRDELKRDFNKMKGQTI